MSRYINWGFALILMCAMCATPVAASASIGDERQSVPQTEPQQPPKTGADQGGTKAEGRPEQRRWMWWRVAETRAELGITDQQSSEIDQIFQATVPALRAAKEELDRLDAEVAQVIKASTADEGTVERLVGRAEHARAKLTTTRTVMFYRMHRILSADQRVKLNALFERWEAERRKSTDSPRR